MGFALAARAPTLQDLTVKNPKLRRRSGLLPPDRLKLVSDEAPEATCLSSFMWLLPAPRSAFFSRCMRLSGKAATVLVILGLDPRTEE